MADKKGVLLDRLSHWLHKVVEAGQLPERDVSDCSDSGSSCEGMRARRSKKQVLVPREDGVGEMPFDAVVTAEQAESALGHNLATELDQEMLETLDLDLRFCSSLENVDGLRGLAGLDALKSLTP